jgi:copper chaperone CopZ
VLVRGNAVNGKYINLMLILAVLVVLGLLALAVRIRPMADHVAVLDTAGMTCSDCAADIETALQKKKGVAAVEVDVANGQVVVGYVSKSIEPESIVATVTGLGYQSRILDLLSIEQFRTRAGRSLGTKVTSIGCAGGCGNR